MFASVVISVVEAFLREPPSIHAAKLNGLIYFFFFFIVRLL